MSDNTTIKFEKTKTIIAKEMGYHDWEKCINDQPNYMVEQVMDKVVESYAEQHLEDVFEEAEKKIKEKKLSEPILELEDSLKPYSLGFANGAKWLLNHLKQRTNGTKRKNT